jgi:L,D-transpeptidase catalytic domain
MSRVTLSIQILVASALLCAIYDGAPMPYMERLTWSGIALHAGGLPGYPESHGCIHLPSEFAKLLTNDALTPTTSGPSTQVLDADPPDAPRPSKL